MLEPNKTGLYIIIIITIKVEGLTTHILKNLIKDKVAVEILKNINNHNLFNKIDLRLLTFQNKIYIPLGIYKEFFKIYYKAETSRGY